MKYSDETIIKLINYGFNLKNIAAELNVPEDYVYVLYQKAKRENTLKVLPTAENKKESKEEKEHKVPNEKSAEKSNNVAAEGQKKTTTPQTKKIEEKKKVNKTKESANIKLQKLRYRYRVMYEGSVQEVKHEEEVNNKLDEIDATYIIPLERDRKTFNRHSDEIDEITRKLNYLKSNSENEEEIQKVSEHRRTLLKERRRILNDILNKVKVLEKVQVNVSQAEKIVKALNFEGARYIQTSSDDKIEYVINARKRAATRKFVASINDNINSMYDVDELQRLRNSLAKNCSVQYDFSVDSARAKINSRIQKIQTNEKNKVSRIPDGIKWVVEDLVTGELDVEKAKKDIQAQAARSVVSREINKFTLTEDQKSKQYINMIKDTIVTNASDYQITNPIGVAKKISELSNNVKDGISVVTKNFIARKDYKSAREVCNHFMSENKEELEGFIRQLQREIIRAELGDYVLNGIKKGVPEGKEEEYLRKVNKLIVDRICRFKDYITR